MQTKIRIEEKSCDGDEFQLAVTFDDTHQFPVILKNPHDPETEQHFEWYFEQYIHEPYTAESHVEACKAELTAYGENLFQQIFMHNVHIYFHYMNAIQHYGYEEIFIELIGSTTEFHSIHWSSLKDPKFEIPLAANGIVFYRKNMQPKYIEANVKPSPVINLLIVTARPGEEDDVNYRTIQRPLINVIRNAKLKVKPHILRPGTYQSLVKHFQEMPKGYYHIVHFDLHGGLYDFDTLQQAAEANTIVFQSRYGLNDIKRFDGNKAFLFFESDEKGIMFPVEAEEMANLLEHEQIPVCILNACQSAKQEYATQETSFGWELIKKGVQLVLAMRYSFSVSAAEIMMQTMYEALFNNKPLEGAIALGLQQLYHQKNREALFGYCIELEDWLLPTTFKNKDVNFNLRTFTDEEEAEFYQERERKYRFVDPQYGFHGRDLDILKIEKLLLKHDEQLNRNNNHLLLQGMGGVGKTTLLKYLAGWWQETGLVNTVFYFGFDETAYTAQQIIRHIADAVLSDEKRRRYDSRPYAVQKGWVVDELNTHRYVLILDNTESITGAKLAIRNTLNEMEKADLRAFLTEITGQTLVILGSRSDESWLKESTFRTNVYQLGGFDEETTYKFAKAIMNQINVDFDREIQNFDFRRLLELLAGYPLALQAVLPNLKTQTAAQILADLRAGDVNLDEQNKQEKTQSIIKCIEYSASITASATFGHAGWQPESSNTLCI